MEEILKLVFLVFVINYTFDGRALCFLCALDSRGSKRFLVSLCNTFSRRKRGKEKKEDGLKFFKKIRGNCSEKVKSGLVSFYFNDNPASSLPPLFSSSSKASPLLSLSFRWEKVRDETSGKRKTHSSIGTRARNGEKWVLCATSFNLLVHSGAIFRIYNF